MRLTVDRLTLLLEYGLSEYQARVYLALLEFPSLPAGALAKAAQIPRNRLYEVLEELQGLGLVEIILGETRSYRAHPLSAYLDRSVADLREKMEKIEGQKSYLAAAFHPPEMAESSDLEAGSTRVLLTRRAVAREIDSLVDNAQRSLVAIGSAGGWERIVHHLARFSEMKPSVELEIFLPKSAAASGGIERLGEAGLNATRWLQTSLHSLAFVADGNAMLLVHPIPDDSRARAGRDFGILTTNPAFVRDHVALVRASAAPRAADAQQPTLMAE